MILPKRAKKFAWIILCLGAALLMFQFYWMVVTSLQRNAQLSRWPPQLIPSRITFENYRVLNWATLARWLVNSTIVAVGATSLNCLFSAMAGYSLAKLIKANWLLKGLLLAAAIPIQTTIIPRFILVANKLKLYDSILGLILPAIFAPLAIYLVRQFCLGLPQDLFDAARIDGASEWQVFWLVVRPSLTPALITIAIIWFTRSWNDLLWQSVMIQSVSKMTAPVGLALLAETHSDTAYSAISVAYTVRSIGVLPAASLILGVPMCVLFIYLQKQLMKFGQGTF